jgi:hypothetical protein
MATLVRTEAEILADITSVQAELRALRAVPMSGSEGRTDYSNAGRAGELRAELSGLRDELVAARTGYGVRMARRVV